MMHGSARRSVLRLDRIAKIHPGGEVLRDVSWEVKAGDRIGLVGSNGAGKSTQLRIIAGLEEATSGRVEKQGDPAIGYLHQEFDLDPGRSVREELFRAFAEAWEIRARQRQVETGLAAADATAADRLENLVEELGTLQSRFEALQGYELEARIDRMLPALGFSPEEGERPAGEFSGGWQMRIALGRLLLQDPDLLLLDEPTNHLDLDSIAWLETHLLRQPAALVVVSHDRAFLDRVCNRIVATERGECRCYLGNYSQHLEQKALEREAGLAAFERQQKELAEQRAFIERFRASATRSSQARSRERQLEKLEPLEAPQQSAAGPRFRFPPAPRSGRRVALVEDLSHACGDRLLFLGAHLEVERGDRIALMGPNGAGKSTLLRLLMGLETPDDGRVGLGPHNVVAGHFEQNQAEALDLSRTVVDTLFELVPDWTQTQVRSLLGSLGFREEAVFKPAGRLSGGEKARLALARLLVLPCNLLLLDEPTNHLDIPAKEMLEEALRAYEGSALVVSHDRAFLARVANRIVELRDGELVSYRGDYAHYLEKKREEAERALLQERERQRRERQENSRRRRRDKERERKRRKGSGDGGEAPGEG